MKTELPTDNDQLLQEMVCHLLPVYFPQDMEDDTLYSLAREEFFRVRDIIEIIYALQDDGYSESPFDAIEKQFEQAVYARIYKGSNQKFAAWQHGKAELHITSIDLINRKTGEFSSGADEVFYDRRSALEHIAHYFDDDGFISRMDCYFKCSIRLFAPPLEERQTYPSVESIFELSGWLDTRPYYTQIVNK